MFVLRGLFPKTSVLGLWLAAGLCCAGMPRSDEVRFVDVRSDFVLFDSRYAAAHDALARRALALQDRLFSLEGAGEPMVCSHQLLSEARWRLASTADWPEIQAELDRLARLVARPETDRSPDAQDPIDGSWGRCSTAWFFRLDASYNRIAEMARSGEAPPHPPRFLDRVNDPRRLQEYLSSVAVSDIAHEGIDHRRELNIALADLMRLILRNKPAGYHWDPRLKARLMSLILGPLRDPATGFWGETYRRGTASIRVPDVGVTFHVIRYLHGNVPDWPKVIDTLLAIKRLRYPQGWMRGDSFLAHDLYDVAALFHLGWAHATEPQRAAMRIEIAAMLDWCLSHTVRPDGSIVVMPGDDSVEAATYFAISLLHEVGYFDHANRFWTTGQFPAAPALAAKLRSRIAAALASGAGGEGGGYYRSALEKLDGG
jgi:hypothetical protein